MHSKAVLLQRYVVAEQGNKHFILYKIIVFKLWRYMQAVEPG
jgi:hypothetical protein